MLPHARAGPSFQAAIERGCDVLAFVEILFGFTIETYVVPWNDLCNDANRLAQCVSEFLVCGANSLSEDLVCPAAVVAECVDGLGQVLS